MSWIVDQNQPALGGTVTFALAAPAGAERNRPFRGFGLHCNGPGAAAALPGKVFHAATRLEQDRVLTAGGRVLCAVGLGDTVRTARDASYALVDVIHWPGMQYRRDIGWRAIARENRRSG